MCVCGDWMFKIVSLQEHLIYIDSFLSESLTIRLLPTQSGWIGNNLGMRWEPHLPFLARKMKGPNIKKLALKAKHISSAL